MSDLSTQEFWKPVVGYEGYYEVSDQGRVRSLERTVIRNGESIVPSRIIAQKLTKNGYLAVNLWRNNKYKTRTVHRLVLEAFVGPHPRGMQACHDDGDRTNNFANNLRWDTPSANNLDKRRHGTNWGPRGTRQKHSKLTEDDVREIRRLRNLGHKYTELAKHYGVHKSTVEHAATYRNWAWLD